MNVDVRFLFVFPLLAILALPAGAAPSGEADAIATLLAADAEGEANREKALAALLDDPAHDPWLLVEQLLIQGRPELAQELAQRTDETDIGPLLVYAGSANATEAAAARARVLEEADAAREAGDAEAALGHLARVRTMPGRASVLGVTAARLQGEWHAEAGQRAAAIEAWLVGGEEALRMGWWRAADSLLWRALGAALQAHSYDLLARAAEGVRALREVHGDALDFAIAVQNLGSVAHWRGDLPGALRHFNEALSLYESLDQADDVAETRSHRSWILAEIGDFRAALDDQRVLARYFEDRPRDANWAANQVHLGLIRYRLGDERGAFRALTEAVEAYRTQGDAEGEAYAQGNLGLTYAMGAQWSEAIAAYRAALDIAEAQGDRNGVATASNDVADALRHAAEADLAEAALTDDEAERKTLHSRAAEALAQGHTLIERALSITDEGGLAGLDCSVRQTRGELLLAGGRIEEAMRVLEPARAEAGRLRAWRARVAATVTLARARLRAKDWYGALREARMASDALANAFGRLADADLARARSAASDVYDIGVSAAQNANSEEDLIYFLEAGRAAALLRGLGGRAAALRATVPRALVQHLDERTQAKLVAFREMRAYRDDNLPRLRELSRAYEALRLEEQQALESIRQAQTEAATQLAPSRLVAVGEVQRRLRATARPGLRQVFALFNFQRDDATALLIEPAGSRIVRYAPESVPPLREAFGLLSAARKGNLDTDALATVKRLLMDPLEIPDGPTRLLVCPDRDLAYIPLAVIVPDDWEIVWEPSATIYDLLAERRHRRGQGVLGLGDPDYRAVADPDALLTRGGPRLVQLPDTRLEIEAITGTSQDRRLLSAAATEHGLREALEADGRVHPWKSVHLACHGLVDVELPALSCLALTPGDGEDGFLSSGEVLRLPLRSDLAVLSACQTGRGKFVRGEGVMSLTRAFMYSGASRVIVSLWDVPDKATAFLMQAFYRHWNEGRGTAESLRLAQIAVRDHEVEETSPGPNGTTVRQTTRPWEDPKNWAAWVLWGLPD